MEPSVESFSIYDHRAQDTVLIASDDTTLAAEISTYLNRNGLSVNAVLYNGSTLEQTPQKAPKAVLCCFKDYIADAPKIMAEIRKRYAQNDLTFIGALSRQGVIETDIFDSVIFPPAHPAQIAGRVNSMLRLHMMQQEIMLRVHTLREDFGIDYEVAEPLMESAFRVLFIGKASPEFMVIINALEKKNVEVIAAFTSFSAFDFLHENPFDAVVMNMMNGVEPAFTISETMRRNSRLYHVPTLFLTGEDFRSHDLAYEKGASDIIPAASSEEEISGRILELARYYRLHQQLKEEFGSLGGERCTDRMSGTYNKAFFQAHLRRVRTANEAAHMPTSLMMIKIRPIVSQPVDPIRISAACHQIGRMIKNMVRMEDVVARLDEHTYAIAFSEQYAAPLEGVIRRINGIVDSTTFQSGDLQMGPFQVDLDIALLQSAENEDSDMLIRRTVSSLQNRNNVSLTG